MAVYGIHLGGYVGGLVGTVVTVVLIRQKRRGLSLANSFSTSIFNTDR